MTASSLEPGLRQALSAVATKTPLLIALDFDGTLAPLRDDPEQSRMIPEARAALDCLTDHPSVTVALVTGRAFESIMRVSEPDSRWFLVGSHGSEVVAPNQRAGYHTPDLVPDGLVREFERVITSNPGTRLERKPFGLALHTRGLSAESAGAAEAAARAVCESWDGDLVIRTGFGILEFALKDATKGDGIMAVREAVGATAVLFAGDDVTDEDGFGVLGADDVAIRVGGGVTIAPYGVADAHAMAAVLRELCDVLAGS